MDWLRSPFRHRDGTGIFEVIMDKPDLGFDSRLGGAASQSETRTGKLRWFTGGWKKTTPHDTIPPPVLQEAFLIAQFDIDGAMIGTRIEWRDIPTEDE